jgi:hypothetical protein
MPLRNDDRAKQRNGSRQGVAPLRAPSLARTPTYVWTRHVEWLLGGALHRARSCKVEIGGDPMS